ncbi:very short patch repair endonuclease [Sphingobium yanoikuyae]|uniref:very short patch repair endonuclease n=1 Tax=Sphingobium yanoikuyae TaxID=13690 RepID=UPI0028AFB30E|nr:very short patch repair endonuclease [Sphingobium yanoikuyae]
MTDIVDRETRSRMMAGIGGRNTRPELALRSALHARGFRFRLHARDLPGKPDIVLPRYRAVIFVHGCFWHRHADCRYATTPATRPEFWQEKFAGNVRRDAAAVAELRHRRWRVAIVWECGLRTVADVGASADIVAGWLRGDGVTLETGGRATGS